MPSPGVAAVDRACQARRQAAALFPVDSQHSTLDRVEAGMPLPLDREMMLDVAPMPGSKRVPIIEIDANGAASIDLWCASVHASATVGDTSITIVADQPQSAQCTPERQTGDQDLLNALSQVTNWRRDGEIVELIGPTTLRFREMTN